MDSTSAMAAKSSVKISFRAKTSKYFGVNKPKGQEGVYAAYVYDKEKAQSVHLGTFSHEEDAARAHDIAALKCSGCKAKHNFPKSEYEETLKLMDNMTNEQVVATIRRCCNRSAWSVDSNFRVVARALNKDGKWMSYKGVRSEGIFLGSFETREKATMAYDIESIKVKRWNALTNFDINLYNVEAILAASETPSAEEDWAKFCKKELLDMPQKYTKNRKEILFLEQLGRRLRGEITGTGKTSYLISSLPVTSGDNQLSAPGNVEERELQNEVSAEQNPEEPSPCHFASGAGSRFRHSSSSCFKPYKRARLG